ncbi:unnamed protein product, partial [Gulo gulo]
QTGHSWFLLWPAQKPEKCRKLEDTSQRAKALLTIQGQRKISHTSGPNYAPCHWVQQPSQPTSSAQNHSRPQTHGLKSSDSPNDVSSKSDPGEAAGHATDFSKSPSQKVRVPLGELSENSQVSVPGRHQSLRSNRGASEGQVGTVGISGGLPRGSSHPPKPSV